MKEKIFSSAIFLFLILSISFFFSNCSKKETITPIETVPSNLFPLKIGNAWYYSGYQIDTSGAKIAGTDFTSSTTVISQIQFQGKNPFVVIDSLKYPIKAEVDTLLVYLDGNNLYAWIDLTNTIGIPGFVYQKWVLFVKTGGNLNEPYTILSLDTTVFVSYQGQQVPLNIRVNITGNIDKKEELQLPAGKFVGYRFETLVTASVSVGGVVVASSTSKNYIWFSPGIGPIKHETPATSSSNGIRRELSSYRLL